MSTAAPHADRAALAGEIDRLYPGPLALLLVALCSPTRAHEHNGRACESPGKVPLVTGWNQSAVERWRKGEGRESHITLAARHVASGGNIGWIVPPGVCVLDADTPAAVFGLEAALPDAPMQESRRGRAHFLTRVPEDAEIKASVKLEIASAIAVDIRSAGRSQIVVEPSRHATGSTYCWRRELPADLGELQPLPAEWLARITAQREGGGAGRANGDKIHEGRRNDYLFRHGCGLRARHRGEAEIREELHAENARHCAPPLSAGEVDAIVANVLGRYAAGTSTDREPEPAADDDAGRQVERPEIEITERQLDAVVDDAVAALVAANDPPDLFLRGGALVSIRRDEDVRPIVAEVREVGLLEQLASAARWVRRVRGRMRDAGPTRDLAAVVGARLLRSDGALPPLRGITESPLMRADGSILDRPGYDPVTRLYFAPPRAIDLGTVPESPSAAQVKAAFALLDELLFDFPIVGDGDFATALAVVLTPPLRELYVGCTPLFLIDAPAPGTGKGLLVTAAGMVGTGTLPAMMPEPDGRDDSEWRKRLTALLLEGRAVAVLDNLERPLGSASLASALTLDVWSDRILGATRMVTVPNRTVFIATGNNLRLRGDLPRRCVWCRLDAREAKPWTRTGFRHPDLLAWVREHRGALLNAVFTLARAWIAAGRPEPTDDVQRLGSFEGWRKTMGGILRVAGVPGFLSNLPALYEIADEDTPAWAGFLAAWRDAFGADAVTVAELLDRVSQNRLGPIGQALPGELAEALDKPSAAKRIGRALARKAEKRFALEDGATVRLVRDPDTHKKVQRWQIREG